MRSNSFRMVNIKLILTIITLLSACITSSDTKELPPPLPAFTGYRTEDYNDEFFKDQMVCGEEALKYWMQSSAWRRNPEGNPEKYSMIERLLSGDSLQISQVNKRIQEQCESVLTNIAKGKEKTPQSRTLNYWIQLALRVPNQLESKTLELIIKTLESYDIAGKEAGYVYWTEVPGANGSNAHGYLTPLTLAPALIHDLKVSNAGQNGLYSELAYFNNNVKSGQAEFNLLESHWNGTASWELIKKFTPDPYLRRMARMITERVWIDRFLTWSPVVGRITGPGSRMAPSEWLGTDNERALLATGFSKPIWLNFFFDWGVWDSRNFRSSWEQTTMEATLPDLPEYLQEIAWNKSYPNELQSLVPVKHRPNYPDIPGVPQGNPLRPEKFVNYQSEKYTIGSSTDSWVTSTHVQVASAWWNNSRNPDAPIGSPKRFCVLYPHYVFNGMSFMDKGMLFFENNPDQLSDSKGGSGGPWMREFADYGRVAALQDRNTLLLTYSPRPGPSSHYSEISKLKTFRASAAMFLFRWNEGTEGLYVNKEPVINLPYELKPGDWWFIEDGDVYAAVRPLKSTTLKGNCKTVLEKRTRHIALYQDNVSASNIEGISNENWVKAQSGFVVEMGDINEYGSFTNFRDRILSGIVTIDEANGYDRHIAYQRDNRELEMKWDSYTEEYDKRLISGKEEPWPQFLQSPAFSVSKGEVLVQDAVLKTIKDNTAWLLSCPKLKTWVAYQSEPEKDLPFELTCPAGRFYTERFPFGKLVLHLNPDNTINIEIDAGYRSLVELKELENTKAFILKFEGTNQKPEIRVNGIPCKVDKIKEEDKTIWSIDPYKQYEKLEKTMLPDILVKY